MSDADHACACQPPMPTSARLHLCCIVHLQPQGEGVAAAWSAVHQLALAACGLLTSHSGEGARVTAVKLVEAVVLLFTADGPPAVAGAWLQGAVTGVCLLR